MVIFLACLVMADLGSEDYWERQRSRQALVDARDWAALKKAAINKDSEIRFQAQLGMTDLILTEAWDLQGKLYKDLALIGDSANLLDGFAAEVRPTLAGIIYGVGCARRDIIRRQCCLPFYTAFGQVDTVAKLDEYIDILNERLYNIAKFQEFWLDLPTHCREIVDVDRVWRITGYSPFMQSDMNIYIRWEHDPPDEKTLVCMLRRVGSRYRICGLFIMRLEIIE